MKIDLTQNQQVTIKDLLERVKRCQKTVTDSKSALVIHLQREAQIHADLKVAMAQIGLTNLPAGSINVMHLEMDSDVPIIGIQPEEKWTGSFYINQSKPLPAKPRKA